MHVCFKITQSNDTCNCSASNPCIFKGQRCWYSVLINPTFPRVKQKLRGSDRDKWTRGSSLSPARPPQEPASVLLSLDAPRFSIPSCKTCP